MPISAPTLLKAPFARAWRNESAQSSRGPATTSIPLKAKLKATVEEIPDDFYEAQRAGHDWLHKSRQAPSGFSLPSAQQALKKFGQAGQMAPNHAAPHAGMFATWRAVHADALGARPVWSKKRVLNTCEQSATAMLRELSWLLNHGSVSTLREAIRFPDDLFVGLGDNEGPNFLREHLLPALDKRFGADIPPDEGLLLDGIALMQSLLDQQPWTVTHALALIESMMAHESAAELAGRAFSRMLTSLGQKRHTSPQEWTALGHGLVNHFGAYSAAVMPLLPLVRRGLRETRDNVLVHKCYVALLVAIGNLGEDKTQLFETVRLLADEALSLVVVEKAGKAKQEPKSSEAAARAHSLIRDIQSVCERAQQVCAPNDRIVAQLGAERLNEMSRQAACPEVAMAAFSARTALGFGVHRL